MLNRFALRIATVQALKGQTIAGANVRDSSLGGIDEPSQVGDRSPVIVVYTDELLSRAIGRDIDAMQGDGRTASGYQKLTIEIGVNQKMRFVDDAGEQREDVLQPLTDDAIEFSLDIMEAQVRRALLSSTSEWADVWRSFGTHVADVQSQRGAAQRDGTRFAGRQLTLSVALPKDPEPSASGPSGRWIKFMELAAAESELTPVLPILNGLLTGTQDVQSRHGLTKSETLALGLSE